MALVKPAAIEANVQRVMELAEGSELCAVVKANGYGHGAAIVAQAALAGGASYLAVANTTEALEVVEATARMAVEYRADPNLEVVEATARKATARKVPVLVLSEISTDTVVEADRSCPPDVHFTVASVQGVAALSAAVRTRRSEKMLSDLGKHDMQHWVTPRKVHLKIDTGMHRLGVAPDQLIEVSQQLAEAGSDLDLAGLWTHMACADEPDDAFTSLQFERFVSEKSKLKSLGVTPEMTHVANSAALLAYPELHLHMTRPGIVIYGVPPTSDTLESTNAIALEPALSLMSKVMALRTVSPGEGVSYGRRWRAEVPTRVATVPIGYADGIRRDSGVAGVEVLVRGQRCRIAGVVTMDQLMIELPASISDDVVVGDDVVLIGSQGNDTITVTEVAERLGTIAYEVLTGISNRVPRKAV